MTMRDTPHILIIEDEPVTRATLAAYLDQSGYRISVADDAAAAEATLAADPADLLLIDAKPAPGAALPGGNGVAFDWRLLAGRRMLKPWLLAGGLDPANVAEAIRLTNAPGVDVSSGVESAPGVKDPTRIAAFCAAAGIPPRPQALAGTSAAEGSMPR